MNALLHKAHTCYSKEYNIWYNNDKSCQKAENNMTNFKVQYLTSISMLYLNIYKV